MNDLPNVSKTLIFYLFADDTNIYYESKNLSDLIKIVNREVIFAKEWLDANNLFLNIDKANCIIFQCSDSNTPFLTTIKIGKKHIKRVKFVKFLGLLLDEHLTWKCHLSDPSRRLARMCGMFFKLKHSLPLDVLVCLYNAVFLSFLHVLIV